MRVLDPRDRIMLADLVARYALYTDRAKYSGLAGLFTDDAVLVLPDPPEHFGPVRSFTGRDEISESFHSLDGFPLTSHEIVGQVFDPGRENATATGHIACVAHHLTEDEPGELTDYAWHLRYTDAYRRESGFWQIARRTLQIDFIEMRPVWRWRA
ncbi:nuclear transport factor 2 family protein [Actinomadura rudentiformis]|uniref:Nuclear transport factor 2 family protein n=1 Tax=Actinomadura rudentiformis TaxID=359158 RepID=A0A6H9YUX8_9ACTN|nr:nuclear transport factor 2 family protein [Actinomadura rudentiformis]KAB2352341.1 nuclear transport factor 2 family protein [Actinomadura rudentiformis]